jgi:hypothetical protein
MFSVKYNMENEMLKQVFENIGQLALELLATYAAAH